MSKTMHCLTLLFNFYFVLIFFRSSVFKKSRRTTTKTRLNLLYRLKVLCVCVCACHILIIS